MILRSRAACRFVAVAWLAAILLLQLLCPIGLAEERQPLILAHYMPWYEAKPQGKQWGWHWTMNRFNPENVTNGKREIASEFYPLIGPYDSGDRDLIEYHLMLMKLAGIDGVIVDWYGLSSLYDYAAIHRNTQRLAEQLNRRGMKLVVCYEDKTITNLVKARRIGADQRAQHAVDELNWLADNWFRSPNYARIDSRPVLLSFGYDGLTDDEWTDCLGRLRTPVAYFSEHKRRTPAAAGGFDWPIPDAGLEQAKRFQQNSQRWEQSIPVAYPRFVDIYKKAKVSPGYVRIDDNNGATFKQTLRLAMRSKPAIIQIATWNDWGEGTQIEPSAQFGYRDLEVLQSHRRSSSDSRFKPQAADLRLPLRLLQLRRSGRRDAATLDRIADDVFTGDLTRARRLLSTLLKD